MFVEKLISILEALAKQVLASLETHKLVARTLTLKVKYANFQQVTRSYTTDEDLDLLTIESLLPILVARTDAGKQPVRLVGLTVSGFGKKAKEINRQLDLSLSDVF